MCECRQHCTTQQSDLYRELSPFKELANALQRTAFRMKFKRHHNTSPLTSSTTPNTIPTIQDTAQLPSFYHTMSLPFNIINNDFPISDGQQQHHVNIVVCNVYSSTYICIYKCSCAVSFLYTRLTFI